MPSITFPKGAFRAAAQDYTKEVWGKGVNACFWRELLQNARDAGATRVDATITETDGVITLVFLDNGRGMDRETLDKGMLTYAGSIKPTGAAGGFGMAKALLVFAPDACEIRTRDLAVRCEGVNYEWLDTASYINGTQFTITLTNGDDIPTDKHIRPTADGLRYLLARSDMRGMAVYCNGELVPDTTIRDGEPIHTWDWNATAFLIRKAEPIRNQWKNPLLVVRHRGIWVMDIGVADDFKGQLYVELDGDPQTVLNAARVSLANYDHRTEIDQFKDRVAKNPEGQEFKTKKWTRRWTNGGLTKLTDAKEAALATARVLRGEAKPATDGALVNVVVSSKADYLAALADEVNKDGGPRLDTLVDTARLNATDPAISDNELAKQLEMLVWRPALMIVNDTENHVDPQWLPETMGKKAKRLLTVWAELIKQLLLLNKQYVTFGVGFVFAEHEDHNELAMFKKEEDGSVWFLFNPLTKEGKMRFNLSDDSHRAVMLSEAMHEVAHQINDTDYHDSRYARALTTVIEVAFNNQPILNRLWKYRPAEPTAAQ